MNATDTAALIAKARAQAGTIPYSAMSMRERLIVDLANALEASQPRVVHTVEELDALPIGTLIEAHRKAIYRARRGAWSNLDGADRFQPNVGWFPATVLWTPEATR